MTEIRLSSGFTAEVDEKAIDDVEMLEELTALEAGDPTAVIRIMKMFGLDRNKRTELYDMMKDENGRAPANVAFDAMEEIFGQLNSKKK